jgi:hypothetical protein
MMPVDFWCPECGNQAAFRWGKWRCPKGCSFVGAHPDGRPLGTLAGKELRRLRKRCHEAFDVCWNTRQERDAMYSALALALGIEKAACHFSMMDEAMCRRALVELGASEP